MRLSPRQLALAIGVSESSLKRWADAGKLSVSRTEGGHRRIAVGEAVRFIRDTGATVVRPDLLGLGNAKRAKRANETVQTDARAVRQQLVGRFLGGESMASLADGVIAEALAALDDSGTRDVKSELTARAATDAWSQAIAALRGLCEIRDDAPVAVGGARAAGGGMRSAAVAAVLAAEGFRVIDLGAGLTTAVQRAAIAAHHPAITWLVDDDAIDLGGYRVRSMAEVAAYARGIKSASR